VAGIVGWLDDPITTAASTPTPTIDPAPTGVPCRAQDLTGVMDQIGGASGNTRTDIVFTNRGATACLLDGYPTLTGVSPDGSLVPLAVGHTTYFGDPGTRGVMAPGGTTAVLVRTSQACGEAVPSASAQWTTVEVGLPAGGAVAVTETDGGRLSTACGISVSRFGLPDHPPPVAPVRAASPLLATIHAPAAARRGATLAYTITLVNPTDAAYPLDPCPSYTEYLTTFDAERTFANARNYRLNCLGLASIPPRSSITFEMQLDVPATQFLGDAKFGWYLDVTGPNTTSQLTVTN